MAAENQIPLRVLSTSPHIHSGDSVRRIMLTVIVALLPALAAAVYQFGWDALRLVVACVLTCVASEAAARRLMQRDRGIDDLSAVVTGILLAFNLPSSLPTWMAVLGSAFAIVVAKQLFGGIGYNPFNPALIGRVMLLASFPVQMTVWPAPRQVAEALAPCLTADAVTMATPLGCVKTALATGAASPLSFDGHAAWQFFLGLKPGCLGEVCGLALLLGGLYLLWRRCITWHVPVFYLGTVAAFAGLLWKLDPTHNLSPLAHLLTGGVLLGAFFMATDMVTTPVTKAGLALFGIGCGVLTVLIRRWGGYPEGVSFAILIMNALTPLLNKATRPRVFGHKRR